MRFIPPGITDEKASMYCSHSPLKFEAEQEVGVDRRITGLTAPKLAQSRRRTIVHRAKWMKIRSTSRCWSATSEILYSSRCRNIDRGDPDEQEGGAYEDHAPPPNGGERVEGVRLAERFGTAESRRVWGGVGSTSHRNPGREQLYRTPPPLSSGGNGATRGDPGAERPAPLSS